MYVCMNVELQAPIIINISIQPQTNIMLMHHNREKAAEPEATQTTPITAPRPDPLNPQFSSVAKVGMVWCGIVLHSICPHICLLLSAFLINISFLP